MTIQTLKLSQLRLSALNVRRVTPSSIDALADDIAAHGLIQNLVAYEEDGQYHVFAGGRRLRALQLNRKRKLVGSAFPVQVDVRPKEEAVELSLAENFQRQAMHPADAVRAFVALRDGASMSVPEIAIRFGQAESHVYKLLRLGSLDPDLLDIFGKDGMTLEAAQALTLTDDHELQREAFNRARGHAHSIRSYLTNEKMTTATGMFIFVGRDAYEAAGGTVTPDLFSEGDQGFADQPELVRSLADERLGQFAEALEAEGWSQVDVSLDWPQAISGKPSLYRAGERELDEVETARLAEIEEAKSVRLAELDEDDRWGDEQLSSLSAEAREIEDGCRFFTDDQKKSGGVWAYVGRRGNVELCYYRAKAERRPSADDNVQSIYPASLVEDLSRIKTQALQDAVSQNPDLALDILLDTLAASLLGGAFSHALAATIRSERPYIGVTDDLVARSNIERVDDRFSVQFEAVSGADRFDVIRAMEADQKMLLLAGLVALTLDGTQPKGGSTGERNRRFDLYASEAALRLETCWAASPAMFERMRKPAMLAILEQECGKEAADNCAKLKKAELAAAVAERLPSGWLPETLQVAKAAQDEPTSEATMAEAA